MFFPFLNVTFAIIGGLFLLLLDEVPSLLQWICLVLGGITIVSRVLAWLSGAAMSTYAMADTLDTSEKRKRMRMTLIITEAAIWLIASLNISYFFV
jgi:hypothetical protein